MLKLILGLKGSGKTKTLIEMVNDASHASSGSVVCIEKGRKLIYDVKYRARLVEADDYEVDNPHSLYGFVAGIAASDHDLSDLFIDSALKIIGNDVEEFVNFVDATAALAEQIGFNVVMTSSIAVDDAPEGLKKYL